MNVAQWKEFKTRLPISQIDKSRWKKLGIAEYLGWYFVDTLFRLKKEEKKKEEKKKRRKEKRRKEKRRKEKKKKRKKKKRKKKKRKNRKEKKK